MPSAKQFTKVLKEKHGKICTVITGRWAGQQEPKKKPSESQKAKPLWVMKAPKDRG